MVMERMTAIKTCARDIINGNWVQKEGMEPSYVETKLGNISRVNFIGNVVATFISEDGNFGSITLDDSTETIRAKAFKDLKIIENVSVGDIVKVIGKVREYSGELYIIPEVIVKVEPNMELLRKLELIDNSKGKASGEVVTAGDGADEEKIEEKKDVDKDALRKEIIKIIESKPEGIEYTEIMKTANAPEETVETVVNEILSEGICYEPSPGKIKKI